MGKRQTKTDAKHVYVIAGGDQALAAAQCDELVGRLVEQSQRVTSLFNVDPESAAISQVLDELRTAPFLSDRRVVVVRDADSFVSKNREILERYFDNPCPTGVLVLTVSKWASNTRLAKKLPQIGELIEIAKPKASQLPDYLVRYAQEKAGKRLSTDAAELLVELVGEELGRLYGEVDKLALYVGGQAAITAEQVEDLVGHNRLFNAFAVIDAIIAGDVGQAVTRLRNMFAEDRSAEYTVVGAFAYHLRRLFEAKALLEQGIRPMDVISRLRIWNKKDDFLAQLRKVTLDQIGDYLAQLGEIDHALKTGRATAEVAVEQFLLELGSR